jgi:hypothetical protein
MPTTLYRDFEISRDLWSIAPDSDWEFSHKDYDGAPDANDNRAGHGPTLDDCKAQIDEMLEDM